MTIFLSLVELVLIIAIIKLYFDFLRGGNWDNKMEVFFKKALVPECLWTWLLEIEILKFPKMLPNRGETVFLVVLLSFVCLAKTAFLVKQCGRENKKGGTN